MHRQGPRLPVKVVKGREQVLGKGDEIPDRACMGVAGNDLYMYQKIVCQKDEIVVGQYPQGRACIEVQVFTPVHPLMLFSVGQEGTSDQKSSEYKKDVDSVGHGEIEHTG